MLIVGLLIGKARAEFGIKTFRRHQFWRGTGLPRGGDLDKARRHFENALAHPRLALLPGDAAEFVEFDCGLFRAIARQKLEVFDWQKKLVAIGVMQFEAIMRSARRLNRLQPGKTPDPMIDVNDDIASGERPDLGQKILRSARFAAAAEQPVAQNILFGDERKIVAPRNLARCR